MKTVFRLFFALMIAVAMAGCGSATEVGNPTGEVPRTIVGQIDATTIPEYSLSAENAVDMSGLIVLAISDDGYEAESLVGSDGAFSLQLYVGKTYSLELMRSVFNIAYFSFEQDDQGGRANSLYVSQSGSEVDLGICEYRNGEIFPENEPRRQMSGQGNGSGS